MHASVTERIDLGLIRCGVGGLELLDCALADRAAHFIYTGADGAILADLRAHAPRAGQALGEPDRLTQHYLSRSDWSAQALALIERTQQARDVLYRKVGADPGSVRLLCRLACVLDAATDGVAVQHTEPGAPRWLQLLLNDALHAVRTGWAFPAPPLERPGWDIGLLETLLAEGGEPAALALPVLFERTDVPAYTHRDIYAPLLGAGALDAYMLANPDHVHAAARSLSVVGQALLVERIGQNPGVAAAYTPLLAQLAVGDSKTVREAAAARIVPASQFLPPALEALLTSGNATARMHAASLAARVLGERARDLLARSLDAPAKPPVRQALLAALATLDAAARACRCDLSPPSRPAPLPEAALDGDVLALLTANRSALFEELRADAAQEERQFASGETRQSHRRARRDAFLQHVMDAALQRALQALNGDPSACAFTDPEVHATLAYGDRLAAHPDFGAIHLLRWLLAAIPSAERVWFHPSFQAWVRCRDPDAIDLGVLADLAVRCGAGHDLFVEACLGAGCGEAGTRPQDQLPAGRVWPYLAMHAGAVDEGLGLKTPGAGRHHALDPGLVLDALRTFPALPAAWVPPVMELALSEGKSHRDAAQRLLDGVPDIGARILAGLASGKQRVRIAAAAWLVRRGDRSAVPALYQALDRERREAVGAAFMAVLEALGEDLAVRFAPPILLAQARKGLKAGAPADIDWFDPGQLPACRWAAGGKVEPEILHWWVALACKVGAPAAGGVLMRYLRLLDPASRAELGRYTLAGFIRHDTRMRSPEEAAAFAAEVGPQIHESERKMRELYPGRDFGAARSQAEVVEEVRREKLAEYQGSALGARGVLALAAGIPGQELADTVRDYMRAHPLRRAQVEALLEAIHVVDDDDPIGLVLATARHHRDVVVQMKAATLAVAIAERKGWSGEELADRVVPTAGLDDSGRMTLHYGARAFTVVLDEASRPVLYDGDGRVLGSLPAPRHDDLPGAVRDATRRYQNCCSALQQVVARQGARLYEAMCAGRSWSATDWALHLLQHPIVGRMARRLAWMELAGDGTVTRVFRPDGRGVLVDADLAAVDIGTGCRVGLAHACLLAPAQVDAWRTHFVQQGVAPLFDQLARQAPPLEDCAATAIGERLGRGGDRLGRVGDVATIRAVLAKRGYQPGVGCDEGVASVCGREFPSMRMLVQIAFTASRLPTANPPATLGTLSFCQRAQDGSLHHVPLGEVPPVLLAEAYGDYLAVAAVCRGHDLATARQLLPGAGAGSCRTGR